MTVPMSDDMLNATVREKLQYHRMRSGVFRDQHGRKWSTELSTETLHPCTPMTPMGWDAPHQWLVPPAKYLKIGGVFGEVAIDYDQWLIDTANARREYETWMVEVARQMYKGAAMTMIANKDPELVKMAGPAPMSPEFIRAMKSGESRWVLGLAPRGTPVPKWATAEMHTLTVVETWDGSDVDIAVTVGKYSDDDDAADEIGGDLVAAAAVARWSDDTDDAPSLGPSAASRTRRR